MCVLNPLDNKSRRHPARNLRFYFPSPAASPIEPDMTELMVQRCLNRLRICRDASAKGIVRELISVSADRLGLLCKSLLIRDYPRLAKGPLNLRPEELLSAVVERLMKAMHSVRPVHFRQFFALAVKHIRWELNEQVRTLHNRDYELLESDAIAQTPMETSERPSPVTRRILKAINGLSPNDREVFEMIRIQGMTQTSAAEILGVSVKTIQRRLNRLLPSLCEELSDLEPGMSTAPA
jgi:RNA polymerase sigma factor (sigma-70 family)